VQPDLARGGGYFLAGVGPLLLACAATPLRAHEATFAVAVVVTAGRGGLNARPRGAAPPTNPPGVGPVGREIFKQ
jgi:hypothetical protein